MKRILSTEDRASRVISNMPLLAPAVSDEQAARELLDLYTKRTKIGHLSPCETSTNSAEINKRYLGRMIKDIESHNRREEISDCWRQHEQIKKSRELPKKVVSMTMTSADIHAEREKWAQLKLMRSVDSQDKVGNVSRALDSDQFQTLGYPQCNDIDTSGECCIMTSSKKSKEIRKHSSKKSKKKDKKRRKHNK